MRYDRPECDPPLPELFIEPERLLRPESSSTSLRPEGFDELSPDELLMPELPLERPDELFRPVLPIELSEELPNDERRPEELLIPELPERRLGSLRFSERSIFSPKEALESLFDSPFRDEVSRLTLPAVVGRSLRLILSRLRFSIYNLL